MITLELIVNFKLNIIIYIKIENIWNNIFFSFFFFFYIFYFKFIYLFIYFFKYICELYVVKNKFYIYIYNYIKK